MRDAEVLKFDLNVPIVALSCEGIPQYTVKELKLVEKARMLDPEQLVHIEQLTVPPLVGDSHIDVPYDFAKLLVLDRDTYDGTMGHTVKLYLSQVYLTLADTVDFIWAVFVKDIDLGQIVKVVSLESKLLS